MLFSVKSHASKIHGFFHCLIPGREGLRRYLLLNGAYGSGIALYLKNVWTILLLKKRFKLVLRGTRSHIFNRIITSRFLCDHHHIYIENSVGKKRIDLFGC